MPPADPDGHAIAIHLDKLLADRGMTLTELSERVGVSVVNLSILKNGHARAIRFSTLTRLCQALDCQPGDLLTHDSTGGRAEPRPDLPSSGRGHHGPAQPSPAGGPVRRAGRRRGGPAARLLPAAPGRRRGGRLTLSGRHPRDQRAPGPARTSGGHPLQPLTSIPVTRIRVPLPMGDGGQDAVRDSAAAASTIIAELKGSPDHAPATNPYYPQRRALLLRLPPYFPLFTTTYAAGLGGSAQADALATGQFWTRMITFLNHLAARQPTPS